MIAEDRTIRAVSPASVEVLQFLASRYRTSSAGAVALAVLSIDDQRSTRPPWLGAIRPDPSCTVDVGHGWRPVAGTAWTFEGFSGRSSMWRVPPLES